MKTLLIMAGGTGGHVIPALAVAGLLRDRGINVVWMGTQQGIEATLVPDAGIELKLVDVKGIRGNGLLRKLSAPWVLLRAAVQAMNIIRGVKANAVLGMGGYVSGPGGIMAWLLRRPLVLHEQNAVAGTTNKLLAPFAKRVLTGFANVAALPAGEHIGNPVRPEIIAIEAPQQRLDPEKPGLGILVIGGSQGAQVFNETLPALFKQLQRKLGEETPLRVIHQCGRGNQQAVVSAYTASGQAAEVHEFISDMASAYEAADLVVCRAGAMTVAEVAAAGAVALFVPLPYAIDDHQYYNAMSLAEENAAICVRQDEFVKGAWVKTVSELAADRIRLIEMAVKARSCAKPKAAAQAADRCMEVMNA